MSVDIFLLVSNGVMGEAQDSKFGPLGGIDVTSWSWGQSQSGSGHTGGGSGAGKVNVQDMHITKWIDLSSHDLILKCASGQHFEWAELVVRKASGGAPVEYYKIKMEQVLISSYQTGGNAGTDDARIAESLSLNFRKYTITYAPQEGLGTGGTEATATWDIAKNVQENLAG